MDNYLRKIDNRRLFLARSTALIVSSVFAKDVFADSHCDSINTMIAQAVEQHANAGAWAFTVSPDAISRLETEVELLEQRLSSAHELADDAKFRAYLSGLNATVSLGFAIAGVFATGAAVPILFIGSIAVGGTVLVADALSGPAVPEGIEVARDIGISRVGGLLSIAGDDAYAISTNATKYSANAGKLLGIIGAGIAAYDAGQKLGAASIRTAQENTLKAQLGDVKGELNALKRVEYATEIREACTKAVEVDLTEAYGTQIPQCVLP